MNPYLLLGVGVAFVVTSISSFFFGVDYQSGQEAKKQIAVVKAEQDQLRQDLKAQVLLAIQAAEKAAKKRAAAREVKREIALLPARVECNWNPDEQRLFDSLYRAYFGDSPSVSNPVREPTSTTKPPLTLGTGNVGMGLRLQVPAR